MKRKREELQALTAAARQVECPAFKMNADDAQDFFDEVIAPNLEENAKNGEVAANIPILHFVVEALSAPRHLTDLDTVRTLPTSIGGCLYNTYWGRYMFGHCWANALAVWFQENSLTKETLANASEDVIESFLLCKTAHIQTMFDALCEMWDGDLFVESNDGGFCDDRKRRYFVKVGVRFFWGSDKAAAKVQAARTRVADCRKKLRVAEQELQDALH